MNVRGAGRVRPPASDRPGHALGGDRVNDTPPSAADADRSAPELPADGADVDDWDGDDAVKVDVRSALVRFIVLVVGLVAVLAVVGFVFHEQVIAVSRGFVAALGGWGVALGFALADAFPLPIPHDVVSTAGMIGGLGCPGDSPCGWRGFWVVVAWASLGTLTGSTLGFAIGRTMSHTEWFQRVMRKRGRAARVLAERYGMHALIIGAVTPINYCIVVWATGALDLSWGRFFAVTWLRIPRVIVYLWLFKIGLIDFIS